MRGLVLLLVLACAPALAEDSPREAGEKLREELAKKPPRPELAGTVRLATHLGLSRVGELRLETEIPEPEKGAEKLYHLDDSMTVEAPGLGSITVTLQADLGADLSVRKLELYTSAPDAQGAVTRRKLTVAPEGDALYVTIAKDEDKPVKKKLEGLDKRAILLTPPLGIGERLVRLAGGEVGKRLSFDGWDLAREAKAALAVSFDEVAKIDIRGTALEAQKVTRDEGASSIEEWLEPRSRELLEVLGAGAERLTFVGRESADKKEDLPEPRKDRKDEGPAETVLRFFRASGRGDAASLEELLDVDAIFEAAKPAERDDKFKDVFKKTLLQMLTSPEWRRSGSLLLLAGATRVEDLVEQIDGTRATVSVKNAKDSPSFELRQADSVWKIAGLPHR